MTTSEVVVREGIDMYSVVATAAGELGMTRQAADQHSWAFALEDGREFVLSVDKLDDGLWRVDFADRPGRSGRSRKSREAEFAVMKGLGPLK